MPTRRQHRLNELLHQELSLLIPNRLDDPRLDNVVITRVETTQDMAHAKVYFTCQDSDDDCAESLQALAQAQGFIRGELAGLGLRRLPRLIFTRDRQYESGQRVLEILRGLHDGHEDDMDEDDESEYSEAADGNDVLSEVDQAAESDSAEGD